MTDEPRFVCDPQGCQVTGELTFATVPLLWHQAAHRISDGLEADIATEGPLPVDLSGVSHADSAGLAMLIECVRLARKAERSVVFHSVPEQLLAIARVSGLERVLRLEPA